jgi:hypothetical protein
METSDIGIRKSLQNLVDKLKGGKTILFIGAAVHAAPPDGSPFEYPEDQTPPLAGALAEKLAKECDFQEQFPGESSRDLQRVSLCFETTPGLGRRTLVDCLDKYLGTGREPSPVLQMLATMPFRIIVTTNYDRLLDDALTRADKNPFRIVYNPTIGEPAEDMADDPTSERPLVFMMHGVLDQRDSIVITDEDYITFVQRMTEKEATHPVPQTVRFRMQRWPTLFIGYSLRDYNLRLLFRTLRWRVDRANFPTAFAVDRSPDPLILKVWQDQRQFITFVIQDLWTFVPWLYEQVQGEEYAA